MSIRDAVAAYYKYDQIEAKAAGRPVRKHDNPEVFEERLREYYIKTSPLLGYYYAKGMLKQVDGMAGIDTVTTSIRKILMDNARDIQR